jgi:hypothetical protein
VRKAVLFLYVERWCEVDSRSDSGVSRCGKVEALPCLWPVAGKGPSHSTGICRQHRCPERSRALWRHMECFYMPYVHFKGVLRPGWRRHGYGKRGEAAVADAAASSGIRAPNKKSPLPAQEVGMPTSCPPFQREAYPFPDIPIGSRSMGVTFRKCESEVLRYRFCSRRTLPETTGLCQALCSHRNVGHLAFFPVFPKRRKTFLRKERVHDWGGRPVSDAVCWFTPLASIVARG